MLGANRRTAIENDVLYFLVIKEALSFDILSNSSFMLLNVLKWIERLFFQRLVLVEHQDPHHHLVQEEQELPILAEVVAVLFGLVHQHKLAEMVAQVL